MPNSDDVNVADGDDEEPLYLITVVFVLAAFVGVFAKASGFAVSAVAHYSYLQNARRVLKPVYIRRTRLAFCN